MIRIWTLGALALLAACEVTSTFACETTDQCRKRDVVGLCEPTGYCSFADTSCPSGHRYDDSAGSGLANECLDVDCTTYASLLDTCALPPTTDALTLSGNNTYNTDTNTLTTPSGTSMPLHVVITTPTTMDVLVVGSFSLAAGAKLGVVGSLPFGVAASGSIEIGGLVDLTGGAGARTRAACGAQAGSNGTGDSNGGPGGGGGAFGSSGAPGGTGDNAGTPTSGAAGGSAIVRPSSLLGGCPGGFGGDSDVSGGPGGLGGGAIYLLSATSIAIGATGAITVGGIGGASSSGTGIGAGGGGGGSGGMIILESPSVVVLGVLAANGGGGAGGGGGGAGQPGHPSAVAALGGAGTSGGSDGGIGSSTMSSGGGGSSSASAGGGGGGAGFVAIASPAPTTTGTISPHFAAWP